MISWGVDPSENRKAEKKKQSDEQAPPSLVSLTFALAGNGALLIETSAASLHLTPEQTTALRSFLDAAKAEMEGKQPC